MTDIEIALIMAHIIRSARANGIQVEQRYDFENVCGELERTDKVHINLEASPYVIELSPQNAAYIACRNDDGKIVAFCAVRLVEVGAEGLSGYLGSLYRRIYGGGREAIDCAKLPPIAARASGRIALVSDLFVSKDGGVGKVKPDDLMMLAMCVAKVKFAPKFMYGFVSHAQMRRGLVARYLSTSVFPGALKWIVESPWDRRDWMILMDAEYFDYAIGAWPTMNGLVDDDLLADGQQELGAFGVSDG